MLLYQEYDPLRYVWSSSLIIKRILYRTNDPLRGGIRERDPLRRGSFGTKGIKGIIRVWMIPFGDPLALLHLLSLLSRQQLRLGRAFLHGPGAIGTSGTFSEGVTRNRGVSLAIEISCRFRFVWGVLP